VSLVAGARAHRSVKMANYPGKGFFELDRPKTLTSALARFAIVSLCVGMFYIIAPNLWAHALSGLFIGFIAGILWAMSWFASGAENRMVVWIFIYIGGMTFWGLYYRDIPSMGAAASMLLGYEFVMLLFHRRLRASISE